MVICTKNCRWYKELLVVQRMVGGTKNGWWYKEWLVVKRMVGGTKNGWWLWSPEEQLNQVEKKRGSESNDPRRSRPGQYCWEKLESFILSTRHQSFRPPLGKVLN